MIVKMVSLRTLILDGLCVGVLYHSNVRLSSTPRCRTAVLA